MHPGKPFIDWSTNKAIGTPNLHNWSAQYNVSWMGIWNGEASTITTNLILPYPHHHQRWPTRTNLRTLQITENCPPILQPREFSNVCKSWCRVWNVGQCNGAAKIISSTESAGPTQEAHRQAGPARLLWWCHTPSNRWNNYKLQKTAEDSWTQRYMGRGDVHWIRQDIRGVWEWKRHRHCKISYPR